MSQFASQSIAVISALSGQAPRSDSILEPIMGPEADAFVPGPVDPSGASAAFGHYGEDPVHNEIALPTLARQERKPAERIKCDPATDQCPKGESSIWDRVKQGTGILNGAIQRFLGTAPKADHTPLPATKIAPDGVERYTDRLPDGTPVAPRTTFDVADTRG